MESIFDGPAVGKNQGTITDKTVFLSVRFGVMGNQRKVSNTLVLKNDASSKLLKINQTLLDSPELTAIQKADGQMRTYLYNMCLPYDMGGNAAPARISGKGF